LGVFVAVALGLMVWFPIYYWLRDRARRFGNSTPNPQKPNRALVTCGILFLAALICAFWAGQQSDLELEHPSPSLLVLLAIICLSGSVVSLAWAIYVRRYGSRQSHDAA